VLEIHNFVLEIINNQIRQIMKKAVLPIVVSLMVLATTVVWILNAGLVNWGENLQFIVIFVLVAFGIYVGYRRFTSEKRGQPAEDEFSKKVMQKAAALSYYISIYIWLVIMYLADKLKTESDVMFGWGILSMAIVFALSWGYYNFRGIRNE
jgi:peptidoglycan/LPS O-acetylase OafA/YrhL